MFEVRRVRVEFGLGFHSFFIPMILLGKLIFNLFAKLFRKQKRKSVRAVAADSRQLVSEMLSIKLKYQTNKKDHRGGKKWVSSSGKE